MSESSVNYIYFILAEEVNRIKIGRSVNPKARLANLQTSSPVKLTMLLEIPSPAIDEPYLHLLFEESNIHGEWFDYSDEIINLISTAKENVTLTLREILGINIYEPITDESEVEDDYGLGYRTNYRCIDQHDFYYGCSEKERKKICELSEKERILHYREIGKSWVDIAKIFNVTPREVRVLSGI